MRENKRPKAPLPACFREECDQGLDKSKMTVTKHSKSKDLRSKLNKK